MLELERKIIEVSIDGKIHNVKMPTYKQSIDYKSKLEKISKDEVASAELFIDYLDSLGLPRSVGETLELDHLALILEHILGARKK